MEFASLIVAVVVRFQSVGEAENLFTLPLKLQFVRDGSGSEAWRRTNTNRFEALSSLLQKFSDGIECYLRLVGLLQYVTPYVADMALKCT